MPICFPIFAQDFQSFRLFIEIGMLIQHAPVNEAGYRLQCDQDRFRYFLLIQPELEIIGISCLLNVNCESGAQFNLKQQSKPCPRQSSMYRIELHNDVADSLEPVNPFQDFLPHLS